MNKRFKDLSGKRYTRLAVLKLHHIKRRAYWLCKCDCGNETVLASSTLNAGNTKSCGCLYKELLQRGNVTHGKSHTREFRTWAAIIDRCTNTNCIGYKNYGGRGIKICDEWRHSFEVFINDMGMSPSAKHQIDRINNDGDYTPNNCRWATKHEQDRNKRSNRFIVHKGNRMIYADWAREMGMNLHTLYGRLRANWSYERIVSEPVRKHGR